MNALFSRWTWLMAWRDSRSHKKRLFIYVAAIIAGVAAQVALISFRDNLNYTLDDQAKTLLGADLSMESRQPYTDVTKAFIDSLGGQQAQEVNFASMVLYPAKQQTRLCEIRALNGPYPFYGALQTQPANAAQTFRNGQNALVDQALMIRFGASVGDSIQIGNVKFRIAGEIQKIPGEAAAVSLIGPRVFFPKRYLKATGLIQTGSRVEYRTYFKFGSNRNLPAIIKQAEAFGHEHQIRTETVADRKRSFGRVLGNLTRFLNMAGFIALLLGGIGVASSVNVYIKNKINTVAVLRCLGAKSNQTLGIFLLQAVAMGFIGSLVGVLAGLGLQYFLPEVFSVFLPVQVIIRISWEAVIFGITTGIIVAVIFALLPLLAVRKISPLETLRTSEIPLQNLLSKSVRWSIFAIIALLIVVYAGLITQSFRIGIFFTISIAIAFAFLWLTARLLIWLVRRFFPSSWSYVWRQGLANLYRPNNQTTTLVLSLGLGMLLISTMYFAQQMLMQQLNVRGKVDKGNLVMFDIQPDQLSGVEKILHENKMPILQNVPIVTMRIKSINGKGIDAIRNDTSMHAERWALRHEYRSTYRDSLISSETLIQGKFTGKVKPGTSPVPVSASQRVMESLHLKLGDSITFNVQGVPVKAVIESVRKVDWQRVQPNFFMVFPDGVLEPAPHFNAIVTHAPNAKASVRLQAAVVGAYPNISSIDLSLILQTVQTFLDKVSFVIRFMALFSVITGLIVLAGSVVTSRLQRIRESVLLRTLGAKRKQIISILAVEYLFLGLFAALTGLIISLASTWLLGYYYFDLIFLPEPWLIIGSILGLTLLTLLIGMLNSRSIYRRPPLEVLRAEVT